MAQPGAFVRRPPRTGPARIHPTNGLSLRRAQNITITKTGHNWFLEASLSILFRRGLPRLAAPSPATTLVVRARALWGLSRPCVDCRFGLSTPQAWRSLCGLPAMSPCGAIREANGLLAVPTRLPSSDRTRFCVQRKAVWLMPVNAHSPIPNEVRPTDD